MTGTETRTLPAPILPPAPAPRNQWEREYEAFQQLLPQLLATHRGQYVVIHEGRVVASGEDDLALALAFFARHGNVPIHVGLVTERSLPPIRVPHYRVLPEAGGAA